MVDWLCQHFLHMSFTVLCEWFMFKCLTNKEPLPLLPPLPPAPLPRAEAETDVAPASPRGEEPCCCEVVLRQMEGGLEPIQLQLQLLRSKADDLQDCLLKRYHVLPVYKYSLGISCSFSCFPVCFLSRSLRDRQALALTVPSFLYTCQPYFNQLETAARSIHYQLTAVPFDTYARVKTV